MTSPSKAELHAALEAYWRERQREVSDEWNRSVSFGDYVVDRWQRAAAMGFGEGASIYDSSIVLGDVAIGSNTWVGPFVVIDGSGGVTIGDYCSISAGVQIYSHDSVNWAVSGGKSPYEYSETVIKNRCYIGPNAVVAKGVEIGEGCIIGANSLVLQSIPPNKKAFGSPCRIVGEVDVN